MATMTMKHFDTLEYVKQAKKLGATEELAEFQAKKMEELADIIQEQQKEIDLLKIKEPATKGDIELVKADIRESELRLQREIEVVRKEISQLRYDCLKFTIWTGVAVIVALGGMLAKGFHWF